MPYDLGTWRHVKYELNLLTGLVTAYVDGQESVREAKLATNPAYVNTLSIRDNLATTVCALFGQHSHLQRLTMKVA